MSQRRVGAMFCLLLCVVVASINGMRPRGAQLFSAEKLDSARGGCIRHGTITGPPGTTDSCAQQAGDTGCEQEDPNDPESDWQCGDGSLTVEEAHGPIQSTKSDVCGQTSQVPSGDPVPCMLIKACVCEIVIPGNGQTCVPSEIDPAELDPRQPQTPSGSPCPGPYGCGGMASTELPKQYVALALLNGGM
jgi:hypothetical protein